MRAMMKSWREASSSRASTLLVSTWMLISSRGMPLADAPDRRHRELDGRRGDRAEKDRAALAALQIGDLAVGLAHLQEHRAGAARQRLAGRRQRDAARQALAQLDAEDVLHFGDHARGGGLRYVEDVGGGADLCMLSKRDDHAHVAELQPAAQQPFAVDLRLDQAIDQVHARPHGSRFVPRPARPRSRLLYQ